MPRLITFGSNDFTDIDLIRDVLASARETYGPGLVIVEGEATSTDRLVKTAARQLHLALDPVPADWCAPCRPTCLPGHRKHRWDGTSYCPAAAVFRDKTIIARGADECAVFLVDPAISASRPARRAIRRAAAAGIPVTAYPRQYV